MVYFDRKRLDFCGAWIKWYWFNGKPKQWRERAPFLSQCHRQGRHCISANHPSCHRDQSHRHLINKIIPADRANTQPLVQQSRVSWEPSDLHGTKSNRGRLCFSFFPFLFNSILFFSQPPHPFFFIFSPLPSSSHFHIGKKSKERPVECGLLPSWPFTGLYWAAQVERVLIKNWAAD